MADTREIATLEKAEPAGVLRRVGEVSGAMNCLIIPNDEPQNWAFQQFTSEAELNKFMFEHNLVFDPNTEGK
jgi:hypothetical protein